MSHTPKRKRGAQPGNNNACKVNRDNKAASTPAAPIPANIDVLLDLEVRVLTRLMTRLEKNIEDTEGQDVSEEQTAQTIRAVHYATAGTLRILRAKQLHAALGQDEMSRRLDQVLTELNEEQDAENARIRLAKDPNRSPLAASPAPFGPLD